jgi:hypothetical protein
MDQNWYSTRTLPNLFNCDLSWGQLPAVRAVCCRGQQVYRLNYVNNQRKLSCMRNGVWRYQDLVDIEKFGRTPTLRESLPPLSPGYKEGSSEPLVPNFTAVSRCLVECVAQLFGRYQHFWGNYCMKKFRGEGLGWGAPSLGTLADLLRKSPGTCISLHGGPFPSEGNLAWGGGLYTGDFDRWMKDGSSGGAALCKGFHEGDLEEGLLYWGTWKIRFLRDMQNAL